MRSDLLGRCIAAVCRSVLDIENENLFCEESAAHLLAQEGRIIDATGQRLVFCLRMMAVSSLLASSIRTPHAWPIDIDLMVP